MYRRDGLDALSVSVYCACQRDGSKKAKPNSKEPFISKQEASSSADVKPGIDEITPFLFRAFSKRHDCVLSFFKNA